MSSNDLTLPTRPSEMAEKENEGMDGKSFAVYTMIPAATAELKQICENVPRKVTGISNNCDLRLSYQKIASWADP